MARTPLAAYWCCVGRAVRACRLDNAVRHFYRIVGVRVISVFVLPGENTLHESDRLGIRKRATGLAARICVGGRLPPCLAYGAARIVAMPASISAAFRPAPEVRRIEYEYAPTDSLAIVADMVGVDSSETMAVHSTATASFGGLL